MNNSVICMSGGYDSTVLYAYLKNNGIELDVYHAFYTKDESNLLNLGETQKLVTYLDKDVKYLNHFKLHLIGEDYIPNRNTLFVMDAIASAYIGEPLDIYLGIIKNFPRYPDCTHEWLSSINNFLNVEFKENVQVKAPFIDLTKDEVFKLGCKLGVKLEDTLSCNFVGIDGKPCEKCENCKWREAHNYPSYFAKEGN